ncbi:hypothetical protein NM688_g3872 [Phlebia brevispora]|uniref:Uncharacterized protein n=1 Tax=Phlebia brevispora TaxID=194682 RepID=A0ACC1T4P0_9APHY|nr:hypothetical protein NM688_g3872 [Phlebia brevispora]
MTNQEFIRLLSDNRASAKEPWVKVRWINVGGVSWDVISALALKYDMHPLALEDVLHFRKNARSKADYYSKHLFLRVLCHTLCSDEEFIESTPNSSFTSLPRSSSPVPMELDEEEGSSFEETKEREEEKVLYGMEPSSRFTSRNSTLRNTIRRRLSRQSDVESRPTTTPSMMQGPMIADPKKKKDVRNMKILKELKKGERVNVKIAPMCIFLFRDGTVITIHQDNRLNLTGPITERLRQRDTGLRTTADASLLVESLLDLVVDQALEVVEEYQSKILKLEQSVLLKPEMKHVRRLHILQGDLILHKRTLEPIKTVIYGLRRYDVDRVAALSEHVDPTVKIQGYMSHKAKIYLADVHDHMEYILSSLDMFAGISENLINYTFNMTSYEMNEVMRRLTLATIIFLPLTLLTGYFGMNFEAMWSVDKHTDVLFWIIALPVMAIVIPMFLWSDMERLFRYVLKRALKRRFSSVHRANGMVRSHVKQTPEEKKESQKKKTPSKKKSETGSWPCKINGCNKVFAREADLKRHQRTTKSHSIPSFACPQCDATFTRTDALRRHQKSRHNGVVIDPQADKDKADADVANPSASKSSSRAGTPDKAATEPSGSVSQKASKDASPKQTTSYYRQHTMHPSYGASRPPLPPPSAPPPMLYDPHYPPPITMPTSAARLMHSWSPVPPPWQQPPSASGSSPGGPASAAGPSDPASTPADDGDTPQPSSPLAQPPPPPSMPPPPPGTMYRVPPPYYPYYPPAHMYPYPPPPEYLAHYGMIHPGMPMPPYMVPMPGPPPPPQTAPDATDSAPSGSASPGSASVSTPGQTRDDEDPGDAGPRPQEVPDSAIDPALKSPTADVRTDGDASQHARERTNADNKDEENATLEAAKVAVEVLLKYQSERNKEEYSQDSEPQSSSAESLRSAPGASSNIAISSPVEVEQGAPAASSNVASLSAPLTVQTVAVQTVSMDTSTLVSGTAEAEEPLMLNADELLTQESLASPPPPA